ncbi:MAG: nucleotide exchange factor GrpE [bacterium]
MSDEKEAPIEETPAPAAEEPQPEEKPQEPDYEALLKAEKDKYLRLAAEYDNYRKRSQKERESLYRDVKADTVTKLLPVYDNLERALKQGTEDEAFLKGVAMTMTQLETILADLGVKPIEAAPGTKFDAKFHNAVHHIEDENLGEGVIAQEFQKGFTLGDKVIRFSVVQVAN